MLSRIGTGDGTWIAHIIPESKQQSMEWQHTSSPIKIKAKQTLSKCKIMETMFWDLRGVLLVDFMLQKKEQRSTQGLTSQLYGNSKSIAEQTARHAVKRCFAPRR
ncbi:uncharacterized protein TNCV_2141 [Trichonephila clavipes]|nr:uncharacterized protein TNCV_2141 [Trichonephila clavipes]